MVPAFRRRVPWVAVAACFAAAGTLCAQEAAANSLSALQDAAAKRTAEWNTLTASLELRLARLLPCDPRVRTAVDEVARAADTRAVALTSYWNMVSIQSKAQVEAIRGLLAREEERGGDWTKDKTEAQQEVAATSAQAAALKASLQQVPALANPQKSLESIAETERVLAGQAQERETNGGLLLDHLRDLLKAGQARQSAIDEQLKSVSAEGQRWSAYYAARQARAQIECFIINPAAATAPPAPRPAPAYGAAAASGDKAMRKRTLAVLLLASAALAQQEARENWRKTDPALERDAATAGATLGARADKAAAEAAKYFTARKAALESLAADTAQRASVVEPLNLAADSTPNMDTYLNGQNTTLGASIDTIARDPDRGIQQLRQALERERTAVAALSAGTKDVQKAREEVAQTASRVEQARLQTAELYQKVASSWSNPRSSPNSRELRGPAITARCRTPREVLLCQ